jgi:hypothetical protein
MWNSSFSSVSVKWWQSKSLGCGKRQVRTFWEGAEILCIDWGAGYRLQTFVKMQTAYLELCILYGITVSMFYSWTYYM